MKPQFKTIIIILVFLSIILCCLVSCEKNVENATVTFMVDGEVLDTKVVLIGDDIIPPEVPKKAGYSGEWDINIFSNINGDKTVNAIYTEENYSVVFKANDENNELYIIDTIIKKYGQSIDNIPQIPEKNGYSARWNIQNFDSIISNMEVRAIYTKNEYTLNFETNGGNYLQPVTAEYGSNLNILPIKEGYDFIGWHKSIELNDPISLNNMPYENLTLYAEWELSQYEFCIDTGIEEYNRTLSKNYGSIVESLNSYSDFNRYGYIFNGWYYDDNFENPIQFPFEIKEDVTAYANWLIDNTNNATDKVFFNFDSENREISVNKDLELPKNVIIPCTINNRLVERIADCAFVDTNVENIVIPSSVKYIGKNAFFDDSITAIEFEQNSRLLSIGDKAFSSTNITEINLPYLTKNIGNLAFENCLLLEHINFDDIKNLQTIGARAFDGTPFYSALTQNIANNTVYIGNVLYDLIGISDKNTIFIKTDTISISPEVFQNQINLQTINIPDSIKYIGGNNLELEINGAFYGCNNLTKIEFSDYSNLITIGEGSLIGCNKLITIGMDLNNILVKLFDKVQNENCYAVVYNQETYYVPNTLTNINILGNKTTIEDYAFAGLTSLESINFATDVEIIGKNAFQSCENLISIVIPNSVKTIKEKAFSDDNNIEWIVFEEGSFLEEIDDYAFEFLENAEFRFSDFQHLKTIGRYAFKNCFLLERFTVPSVEDIGNGAFAYCKNISDIFVPLCDEIITINNLFEISDVIEENYYINNGYKIPSSLNSVHIYLPENSEKNIGLPNDFFKGLKSITEIILPANIKYIGSYAFEGTDIEEFILPDEVETIGENAFENCDKLLSFTINSESLLKSISSSMFKSCSNISNIFIPKNVNTIMLSAFDGCSSLKNINVDEQNDTYFSDIGILYCGNTLLFYPKDKTAMSYTIKDNTVEIANYAFEKCVIQNIVFPDSIETTYENSFKDCKFSNVTVSGNRLLNTIFKGNETIENLVVVGEIIIDNFAKDFDITTVQISDGICEIGESAFEDCKNLTSIDISDTISSISTKAFYNCNNCNTINFQDTSSLLFIGQDAFTCTMWFSNKTNNEIIYVGNIAYGYKGDLQENAILAIRPGTTIINEKAFQNKMNISNIIFPESLKKINNFAFEGLTNITSLTLPNSVEYIGKGAFKGAVQLSSLHLSENLMTIDDEAFMNDNCISSINFSNKIKTIGKYAFYNTGLGNIILPGSITSIGEYAFSTCDNLFNIIFENINNLETIGENAFSCTPWYDYYSNNMIVFNNTTLYSYKGNDEIIVLPSYITRILDFAFANNENIESVVINQNIFEIGRYAFSNCTNLVNISFANGGKLIENIGENAFDSCTSITTFSLPENLSDIDISIFNNCTSLKDIIVNEENEFYKFDSNILYNYDFSQIIYVPLGIEGNILLKNNLTSIPANSFQNRENMKSIRIFDKVASIGANAFENCFSLKNVYIGEQSQLTSIGEKAFRNTDIDEMILPRKVATIGKYAFNNIILGIKSTSVINLEENFIDTDSYIFVLREILDDYIEFYPGYDFKSFTIKVDFYMDNNVYRSYDVDYNNIFNYVIPSLPDRTGFSCWWNENDLNMIIEDDIYLLLTDDVNISAVYERNNYTITLNDDENNQLIFEYEQDLEGIEDSNSKIDAQFLFWSESQENPSEFSLINMPARDIELYPIWFEFEYYYLVAEDSYEIKNNSNNTIYPETIIIPNTYNEKAVIKIADYAFYENKKINDIIIPSSIKAIGNGSFSYSSINEITLNESTELKNIESYAFYKSNIKSINFPDDLDLIDVYAFGYCKNLENLSLTIDYRNIKQSAFSDCENLKTVEIFKPDNDEDIITGSEGYIFQDCSSLESVILPTTLNNIPVYTFYGCTSLKYINLENIENIEAFAFMDCANIEYINLENVITISKSAFCNCVNLSNINLNNNTVITNIKDNAFYGCKNINYIVFPESLITIEEYAFENCENLKYVIILDDGDINLTLYQCSIPTNSTIYVSARLSNNQNKWENNEVKLYRAISNNFVFVGSEDDLELLLYIGDEESITLPEEINNDLVKSINDEIFINSKSVKTIEIGENILSLINDGRIFRYCESLENINSENSINGVLLNYENTEIISYPTNKGENTYEISNDIVSIRDYAFYGINLLSNLVINNSTLISIQENTFGNLPLVFKVYVPDQLLEDYRNDQTWKNLNANIYSNYNTYGDYILVDKNGSWEISQYIGKDENIEIPYTIGGKCITSIGNYAFYGSNIKSIEIPTNIINIGNFAFAKCDNLNEIDLSSNIAYIGDYAFFGCSNLLNVYFDQNIILNTINQYLFSGCISLQSIIIPQKIISIENNAFENCVNLLSINTVNNSFLQTIGEKAFYNCKNLKNVYLGKFINLKYIGERAFSHCSDLQEIHIPENVSNIDNFAFSFNSSLNTLIFEGSSKLKEIGEYCFYESINLNKITIPALVERIGKYAFYANDANSLVFENGSKLSQIQEYAFYGCQNILSIYFVGNSINKIESNAFSYCQNLQWIKINNELPFELEEKVWEPNVRIYVSSISINQYRIYWSEISSSINSLNSIVGDYSIKDFNDGLEIFQYLGKESEVVLPEKINNTDIISIGSYAFNNTLDSITLSDNISTIKSFAFYNSNLENISISQNIIEIEDNPFVNCKNLKNISVDENNEFYLSSFGALFSKDNKKIITIPNNKFEGEMFSYNIPSTVVEIGNNAFDGCINIQTVLVSENVSIIGDFAFANCSELADIEFQDISSIRYAGEKIFYNSLWFEQLNDGIIYLTTNGLNQKIVYNYKGIMPENYDLTIEDDTITILPNAFKNQTNLSKIHFPSTLALIGENILNGCSNLEEITVPGEFNLGRFFGENYYQNSYQAYNIYDKTIYYLPNNLTVANISDNSKKIRDYMFNNCHSLEVINIPNSVEYIGKYAFYSSVSPKMSIIEINFDDYFYNSLKVIASYAFYGCDLIKNLNLPNSVEKINSYAFYGLSTLETLNLETLIGDKSSNLSYIGRYAFSNNTKLETVVIPQSLKYISNNAFYACSMLEQVEFDNNGLLESIGDEAFMNCTNLRSITTSINLKSIGNKAFYNCIALESFNVDNSVENLIFIGCDAFTNAPYYDGVSGIIKKAENTNAIIYFANVAYSYNGSIGSSDIIEIKTNTKSLSPGIFSGSNTRKQIYELTTILPESTINTVIVLNPELEYIGDKAFSGCYRITDVTLPRSVKYIGNKAFSGCTGITNLTFQNENSIERIGHNAFDDTPWYDDFYVNYDNDSIVYIGNVAYTYKGILGNDAELSFNENTISISSYAFENQNGIVSIKLPGSIKYIGQFAFNNNYIGDKNSGIHTIYLEKDEVINDIAGIFTTTTKIIMDSSPINLNGLCEYSYMEKNSLGNEIIMYDEIALVDLLLNFKANNKMPCFYVPRHLIDIYYITDGWDNFTDYILPYDGIYENYVVAENGNDLDIVYYIGDEKDLVIPSKLDYKDVTGIRSYAFNNKIESVILSDKIKNIGDYAFAKMNLLSSIYIPSSVENIGKYAFNLCSSLNYIEIPGNVKLIDDYAFYDCNLYYVKLNEGTTYLGKYSFSKTKLMNITIPSSVSYMGKYIFDEVETLKILIMKGSNPPIIGENKLYYHSDLFIFMENDIINNYKNSEYWEKYNDKTKNITELANFLLDIKTYNTENIINTNKNLGMFIDIYIAPETINSYIELETLYQEEDSRISKLTGNINYNYLDAPDYVGEYVVYVVIDDEIVSKGTNIITIIQNNE